MPLNNWSPSRTLRSRLFRGVDQLRLRLFSLVTVPHNGCGNLLLQGEQPHPFTSTSEGRSSKSKRQLIPPPLPCASFDPCAHTTPTPLCHTVLSSLHKLATATSLPLALTTRVAPLSASHQSMNNWRMKEFFDCCNFNLAMEPGISRSGFRITARKHQ